MLLAVPAASAKFAVNARISDKTPVIGQRVTVVVTAGQKLEWDLRLIAVAPGKKMYDVVGVITGASRTARARVPRDGFEVKLKRLADNRWQARIRFPRSGRWRLVVPNWVPDGYSIPPPLIRTVVVRRQVA